MDEHYTTVTCAKCGFVNSQFEGKELHCRYCRVISDGDKNAACNMLLHYMTKKSTLSNSDCVLRPMSFPVIYKVAEVHQMRPIFQILRFNMLYINNSLQKMRMNVKGGILKYSI